MHASAIAQGVHPVKFIVVVLFILVAVILFALFGPTKPQPQSQPVAVPAQPASPSGPRPAPGAPPMAQTQPQPSPRQQGELSVPVAATGVTLETVNQGSGGATFEAKRRMTDKLQSLSPSPSGGGGKKKKH
jgi:hypothetical protein